MQSTNSFKQTEDEYFVLRGQLDLGRITREQFDSALRSLMLQDTQGRYWMLGVDSARWFVHDGLAWVESDPYSVGVDAMRVASALQPERPAPMGTPEPYPVIAPTPQPSAPAAPAPRSAPSKTAQPKPKKGWGCARIGCVTVLALLLLIAGAAAALYFRVPQQIGLTPTAARTFADTPDREAAATMKDEMTKAGIDTRGMGIYVLPFRDKPGNVAYVVLDASQGFSFKSGSKDPVTDYLKQMAQSKTTDKYGIERIAMEYKSASGASLLSLTASTDSIKAFASGALPRSEFLKALDGQVNWVGFYQEISK